MIGIPFKNLFYKKRMIIGTLVAVFLGAFYSRHLICFSTETFRFYGKGRVSSSWKRLSSYVKGLSAPCVVFGTLANIPWTVLHT